MTAVPRHIGFSTSEQSEANGSPSTTGESESSMRYMMMTKATDTTPAADEKMFAEMSAFIEELTASGALLATGGLAPGGTLISSVRGEITVTDGPFTEAKEAVVGFALVEARTKEEAVELARRFRRIAGDGESIIQQVFTG
ncbi:YciI family protein [Streptomyces sp. NPDC017979]|uniref:YciI family protein n=1 Tax=Streptomyces sp. NPDC017979 TaxID=3365024 RepID=UPI003794618C